MNIFALADKHNRIVRRSCTNPMEQYKIISKFDKIKRWLQSAYKIAQGMWKTHIFV